MIFYVDGQFIDSENATIPITDLAVLRGYGVFDFMRTYNGEPFHLDQHIARLFRSAEELGMAMPWTQQEVIDIVMQTVAKNTLDECNVRIVVTGGESLDFITPEEKPRLAVLVTPASPPAAHYYTDGAKIITVRESRYLPLAKSLNYIPAIRALKVARQVGAVEAIYVDDESHALEGTTTNLFAFFDGTLVTPDAGILPGITRQVVLDLVDGVYPVEIRPLTLDVLYQADEVFISASNKQVMPVVQVDDTVIGDGKPGAHTRRVMALFGEHTGVPLPMPQAGD
jgi:branched-chain amino acid aminotransferase